MAVLTILSDVGTLKSVYGNPAASRRECKMPTSQQQATAFLELRNNLYEDRNWKEFWKRWDGFIWVIIRRKLFFDPEMWEDCKSLVDVKIFRYIKSFDETRGEISSWLSRLITSCCEDTKEQNKGKYMPGGGDHDGELSEKAPANKRLISLDDESIRGLLNMIEQPESGDDFERREMADCLWRCIWAAMEEMDIDPRHKNAFEMFYKYEFKLREIAEIYHLSEKTVNNWPGATLKKILPHVKTGLEKLGYRSRIHNEGSML
jgi:RNA polymerase sigma factor (sigma-70 family)